MVPETVFFCFQGIEGKRGEDGADGLPGGEVRHSAIQLRLLFQSQNSKPQNLDLKARKARWTYVIHCSGTPWLQLLHPKAVLV
jgi:hypothetical protein